jgi:hypothetical protein
VVAPERHREVLLGPACHRAEGYTIRLEPRVTHEHLTRREIEQWRDDGAGDRARVISQIAQCATCRALAAEAEREALAADTPSHFDPAAFAPHGHALG